MAAAEHSCADGHEVCDGVVAIANELSMLVSISKLQTNFRETNKTRTSCRLFAINACATQTLEYIPNSISPSQLPHHKP